MKRFRLAGALASVAVLAGAALSGASPASADEIWHQGIERAGERAACPKSSGDELASGWSEWAPSWAEWANNGKGGFVCTRDIVWAKSGGPGSNSPSSGGARALGDWDCVSLQQYPAVHYADLNGSDVIPYLTQMYLRSDCTEPNGLFAWQGVYVPEGTETEAEALCIEVYGDASQLFHFNGGFAWGCYPPPPPPGND